MSFTRRLPQLLEHLGVLKTHNRPYTSNDNPFSESQFKTLKYCPQFPNRFESIVQAEAFCQTFFSWYNTKHYHSGILWLTPESVHYYSAKRSWRKLHIAVDNQHILHASDLTDRFSVDSDSVKTLVEQIDALVNQFMADGAYDQYSTYETLSTYFPNAESVIPPDCNAIYDNKNHSERNRNLQEIKTFGRMNWQRVHNYGLRNYSELAMLRYKKTIGNRLHAIEL